MASSTSPLPSLFLELTFENCYEEVEQMTNTTVAETGGVKVVTGDHPQYGRIHIVIPIIGNGMILLPHEWREMPMLIQADF